MRRERRSEWGNFHEKMAQLHAWLSEEHAAKAAQLCEGNRGRASVSG